LATFVRFIRHMISDTDCWHLPCMLEEAGKQIRYVTLKEGVVICVAGAYHTFVALWRTDAWFQRCSSAASGASFDAVSHTPPARLLSTSDYCTYTIWTCHTLLIVTIEFLSIFRILLLNMHRPNLCHQSRRCLAKCFFTDGWRRNHTWSSMKLEETRKVFRHLNTLFKHTI